jgi:glycosyltransferase involved in cell wall biosynthesis
MQIGIDASRLAVEQPTGTENYAFQIIRQLARIMGQPGAVDRLTLYFNQPPAPAVLAGLDLPAPVELKTMPFPRLWTHLRLSREMLQHPPAALFVPAHVLPLVHPARSVVTIHDLGYLYFPQAHTFKARQYLDLSTRFSAARANRVIAISQATKNDLARHYAIPPAKIEVIYHGYDKQRFFPVKDEAAKQAARARYNIGPGRFLVYVGTLQPRKNLLRLLEAYAALAAQPEFKDLQLVLAGKPGWLSQPILDRAAQLQKKLPGRLILPGYLAENDLPLLLRAAEAFVFPSLYEGFGMPVLEALACGCPVVCANSSSLPEVAGEAALYHHPLDTLSLAAQLRRLLTQPGLRAEMVQKGLAQAALFSWEAAARKTLQVITG